MQAEELLSVTPEDLVVAILERRKAAAASFQKSSNGVPKKTTGRTIGQQRVRVKRLEELEQEDESYKCP